MALRKVRAVQLARRMRSGAQLEHHRREAQRLDSGANRLPLRRHLPERR
jgi:hypothetical protein